MTATRSSPRSDHADAGQTDHAKLRRFGLFGTIGLVFLTDDFNARMRHDTAAVNLNQEWMLVLQRLRHWQLDPHANPSCPPLGSFQ